MRGCFFLRHPVFFFINLGFLFCITEPSQALLFECIKSPYSTPMLCTKPKEEFTYILLFLGFVRRTDLLYNTNFDRTHIFYISWYLGLRVFLCAGNRPGMMPLLFWWRPVTVFNVFQVKRLITRDHHLKYSPNHSAPANYEICSKLWGGALLEGGVILASVWYIGFLRSCKNGLNHYINQLII